MKKLWALLGFLVCAGCTISELDNDLARIQATLESEGEQVSFEQTADLYRSEEGGDLYAKLVIALPEGQKFLRFQIQEGKFVFWGRKLKNFESPAVYELTDENSDLLKEKTLTITGKKEGDPIFSTVPVKKIRIIEKREVESIVPKKTTYG